MPITDAVILNLIRIFDRTGDLKTFHKNAENHYKVYFPSLTNYENFMKASNKSAGFIIAFVQYQLYLNRIRCTDSVFYVDSTPVSLYVKTAIFRPIKFQKVSQAGENLQKARSSVLNCRVSAL
nr:hypothetical protein [Treponema sp. Marseille-Q3903]